MSAASSRWPAWRASFSRAVRDAVNSSGANPYSSSATSSSRTDETVSLASERDRAGIGSALPDDLLGGLVRPQAPPCGVAESALVRPLTERHLADQAWGNPSG